MGNPHFYFVAISIAFSLTAVVCYGLLNRNPDKQTETRIKWR